MEFISVAMAAYNGEKYIAQQIQSILSQLKEQDELVISLDPSQDATKDIILSFQDRRITLVEGPGQGLIKNFENAIEHTKNDIIFLCDQDDVWREDKVECVLSAFDSKSVLVLHDCAIVDQNLSIIESSFFSMRHVKQGFVHNIMKNSYIGACMAFRKELKEKILPFPSGIPMHDQWIGLIAEKEGQVQFLDKQLLYYRRHQSNVSQMKHSSIKDMIGWRIGLIHALRKRGYL